MAEIVLEDTVPYKDLSEEERLRAGYAAMAADVEREAVAAEWCELLVGDAWIGAA